MDVEQPRPTLPAVLDRFKAYHQTHPGWGPLHVVLADNNVTDDCVDFCIKEAEDQGDAEGAALARVLRSMSKTQRLKLGHIA